MSAAAVCAEELFGVVRVIVKTLKEWYPVRILEAMGNYISPLGPTCVSSSLTAAGIEIPVKS